MVNITRFLCLILAALPLQAYGKELRTVIAVVDSGINRNLYLTKYLCKIPAIDLTGHGTHDVVGHGTDIATTIAKGIDPAKHCLLNVKWFHKGELYPHNNPQLAEYIAQKSIEYAVASGAKLINMSMSGDFSFPRERLALEQATDNNTIIVVAAGNDGKDLDSSCQAFPACYWNKPIKFTSRSTSMTCDGDVCIKAHKNQRVFVAANYDGLNRHPLSNYGGPVNCWANGINTVINGRIQSGTSISAAKCTAMIASKLD